MPSSFFPPFMAPQLKCDWAIHLIGRIDKGLAAYRATAKAEYKIEASDNTRSEYRLQFTPPMPTEIPMLIGDAVHSLRTSLDLMMNDIAELRDKERVFKFPFAKNEGDLKRIVDKETLILGRDIADLVLAERPFIGGNVDLRGLHDWDILDKHRIIMPIFGGVMHDDPGFKICNLSIQMFGAEMPVYESQLWDVSNDLQDFAFPPVTAILAPILPNLAAPFEGLEVVKTLRLLHNLVCDIVDRFAAPFRPETINPTDS